MHCVHLMSLDFETPHNFHGFTCTEIPGKISAKHISSWKTKSRLELTK